MSSTRRARRRRRARPWRREAEPGLLVAGEHLDRDAEHVLRGGEERRPVRRVAGHRGGDGPDAVGTVTVQALAQLAEQLDGAGDGGGIEAAGLGHPGAEAGDDRPTLHLTFAVDHEQPDGVRADVDGAGDHDRSVATCGEPSGHPAADRVVAAGEVPRVVGVEALDSAGGPAHPAAGGVRDARRARRARVPRRSDGARPRGPADRPRPRHGAPRRPPPAGRPRPRRFGRPASSASAWDSRRRAGGRCGSRRARRRRPALRRRRRKRGRGRAARSRPLGPRRPSAAPPADGEDDEDDQPDDQDGSQPLEDGAPGHVHQVDGLGIHLDLPGAALAIR